MIQYMIQISYFSENELIIEDRIINPTIPFVIIDKFKFLGIWRKAPIDR